MSSPRVCKYRLYCNTDNKYEYVWSDTEPQACPINNTHSIDLSTISIIQIVEQTAVNIVQEVVPTGGHYRTESKKLDIPGNATEEFTFIWPYPISVLTMTLYSGDSNENDVINTYVAPDTTIGIATQNVAIGETVLHVNNTVTSNIGLGYRVNIATNNSSIFVGECIGIDKANGTITLDTPLEQAVNVGDYIQMCVNNIKNFVLKGNTKYELARKTIGASYIPENTIVKLVYENKSADPKTFFFAYEILY